jgi:hypothetical protein
MVWKEFVSVFAQEFLSIVLPVLASLLAGLVIAWISKVVNEIKGKMDDRFIWVFDEAVRVAVLAAEQAELAGYIANKKAYAIDIAQRYLESRGFKIDLALLSDRIEAAVMEQFNKRLLEKGEVEEDCADVG